MIDNRCLEFINLQVAVTSPHKLKKLELYTPVIDASTGLSKMKNMRPIRIITSLCLLLVITLAVSAHDTWLLARRTLVAPGAVVWLDLTSGMTFSHLEYAIKADRIEVAQSRLNGQTFTIAERATAPKSLLFKTRLSEAGVATVWVQLKPKSLELTPEKVEEYFAELNASAALRANWANAGKGKRWRELYVKHAKTFVRVGEHASDQSWAEPVGMTLEIVPEKNPTMLHAGDDFSVRVLKGGTPLANFSLGIVREGNTFSSFKITDAEGRVTFRLPRAGKWLLRGTDLRASTKPDLEWESDFTTLTIVVQ